MAGILIIFEFRGIINPTKNNIMERIIRHMIDRAMLFAKELLENEFSGHDYFHTLRVFKMATFIAIEEHADLETVQLAAILHDVDDRKLFPKTCSDQRNAKTFLLANGVETSNIDKICKIIREVSYMGSDSVTPETLEGKCVQDADRLDAIGAIGIARAFAYGGNHNRLMHHPDIKPNMTMNAEEYIKNQSTTLNHFHEKLFRLPDLMNTDSAKRIAMHRADYMHKFVSEFMEEWDGLN